MPDTICIGHPTDRRGNRDDPNTIGVGIDGPKGRIEPDDAVKAALPEGVTSLAFEPRDWRAFVATMTLVCRYKGWLTPSAEGRFLACMTEETPVDMPNSAKAGELRGVAFDAEQTPREQAIAFRRYIAWCCDNRTITWSYASAYIVDYLRQDGSPVASTIAAGPAEL